MTGFSYTEFEGRTLSLVRKQVTQVLKLPAEMVECSVEPSYFADSLIVRLRAAIYGEVLPPHTETHTEHIPDGWWQHFRKDHAEKWWMRRSVRKHPIRTTEVKLTATWEQMAAYPWAELRTQPVPSSLGDVVHVSWMTSEIQRSDGGGGTGV